MTNQIKKTITNLYNRDVAGVIMSYAGTIGVDNGISDDDHMSGLLNQGYLKLLNKYIYKYRSGIDITKPIRIMTDHLYECGEYSMWYKHYIKYLINTERSYKKIGDLIEDYSMYLNSWSAYVSGLARVRYTALFKK